MLLSLLLILLALLVPKSNAAAGDAAARLVCATAQVCSVLLGVTRTKVRVLTQKLAAEGTEERPGRARRRRCSVCSLYWYTSTNADAEGAQRSAGKRSKGDGGVGVTAAASRQAVRECLANSYRLLLRRARLKFDMGGHSNYEEYLKMVSHIYICVLVLLYMCPHTAITTQISR